jgi:predicted house-cleaning noncanonical NTP pyrophosphatase (MazG superfamily)
MTELIPKPYGHPIKIVRDRTPDVINSSGEPGTLFYRRLTSAPHNRAKWLNKKLIEECAEYVVDGTLAELCDVLAVIEGLALLHGTNLEALIPTMRADIRGGFKEGMMMYGHHSEFDDRGKA